MVVSDDAGHAFWRRRCPLLMRLIIHTSDGISGHAITREQTGVKEGPTGRISRGGQ